MDEFKEEVERTVSLYKNGWFNRVFARIRFWDAPLVEAATLVPKKGVIVDLGCGEGLFTNFLAITSPSRKILGIELDRKRIALANQGLKNVSYREGDALTVDSPKADGITMIHLLHHLPSFNAQIKLLKKVKEKLKPGGKLIIVEVEPKPTLRFLLTWLTDHFLVPWIFERRFYSSIFFRKGVEWRKVLSESGFNCEVINAEKGHPFTHIILKCQKK